MLFDELPIYQAVSRVCDQVESPGSDDWISANARTAYKLVLAEIVEMDAWTDSGIPWSLEKVVEVWRTLRKNTDTKTKVKVSLKHGSRCFYAGRGVGECTEEVDLDRILPGSRGGLHTVENCFISCTFHNRSRGDKSIEEFLNGRERLCASEIGAGAATACKSQ